MSFRDSPLVVGHRGGRGEGWPPENTMAAFDRARREGARAIELDVRTSAEGALVVFHDVTLGRMTGGRDARRVADVSADDLVRLRLGEGADTTIPLLDDVLAWAAARAVAVNVELKHDVPSRVTLARAAARVLRGAPAEVLVSSFDPLLLAAVRALAPGVPRAQLTHAGQRIAPALHAIARPPLLQAVHIERREATPAAVARFRRRGLRVGVWTVNDPEEARDLVRLGVETVITDQPARILAALAQP